MAISGSIDEIKTRSPRRVFRAVAFAATSLTGVAGIAAVLWIVSNASRASSPELHRIVLPHRQLETQPSDCENDQLPIALVVDDVQWDKDKLYFAASLSSGVESERVVPDSLQLTVLADGFPVKLPKPALPKMQFGTTGPTHFEVPLSALPDGDLDISLYASGALTTVPIKKELGQLSLLKTQDRKNYVIDKNGEGGFVENAVDVVYEIDNGERK